MVIPFRDIDVSGHVISISSGAQSLNIELRLQNVPNVAVPFTGQWHLVFETTT